MATVDMNFVQIYHPLLNPPFRWKNQIASSHTDGRSVRAVSSLSQAALPRNKLGQILESSIQFKPEIVATLDKRHEYRAVTTTLSQQQQQGVGVEAMREEDYNVEDPRPAKRQKLRSAPAHKGQTPRPQNLTSPSATQLEVISRCDNQPETRKSSFPSPTSDEESTSKADAAYQEWPMRGFFKLITIGNEVRYGMEFSLEDVQ